MEKLKEREEKRDGCGIPKEMIWVFPCLVKHEESEEGKYEMLYLYYIGGLCPTRTIFYVD